MKKFMVLLATSISCTVAFAQDQPSATPYLVTRLTNAAIQNVLVQTEGGYITVTGVDPQHARIEVFITNKTQPMTNEEIKQDLKENYEFKVGAEGTQVNALFIRKSGDLSQAKRLAVSFRIYVPENVNTDLTTAGGDIQLLRLNGNQRFVTSGGKLNIVGINGTIKGSTSGGDILVTDCKQKIDLSTAGGKIVASRCDGEIDLSTAGGKIIFQDLSGKIKIATGGADIVGDDIKGDLNASTQSGNIHLSQLSCGVLASTTNGNVYAQVKSMEGTLKLYATQGDLSIVLPKLSNADIDVTGDKITSDDLENFKGIKEGTKVKGQLNIGGAKLIGSSTGGQVDIKTF